MPSSKAKHGYNDLATKSPQLVSEWNYDKNNPIVPEEIAYLSNKKVWWKCSKCGAEWQSTVNNRTKGNGCPVCANKRIVVGYNDFASQHPELMIDWDWNKNQHVNPNSISSGSSKRVWWKCSKCGHEWCTTVASRTSGTGCKQCSTSLQHKNVHDLYIILHGSLLSEYPALCLEWNYKRNGDLSPLKVSPKAKTKIWWTCSKCGHEWQATAQSRANGTGCPVCANKTIIPGVNDLKTLNTELSLEWDYEKNGFKPSEVSIKSGKKVWWKCSKCGYEWQATISHRANGTGCPKCFSRNQTSFPEQAIFYYVKQSYPDARNSFQELFTSGHGMELDIFIPSISFAIEYDGAAWHGNNIDQIRREEKKYLTCKNNSIFLLRIKEKKNAISSYSSDNYADDIIYISNHPTYTELDSVISSLSNYLTICIEPNCARDEFEIKQQYFNQLKDNSVESLHPELVSEWNNEKNHGIQPSMVACGSSMPIWWKCKKGHEWKVSPSSRITFNSGCPYCSNKKVLKGYNDFATTHPDMLSIWNFDKNDCSPHEVISGSVKKVWWKCKNGHEWRATIYSISKGGGCPVCAGKEVLKGFNDLASKYPDLALEWSNKNGDLLPIHVTEYSNKKVWWKCKSGHEWQTSINNRTKGSNCPICSNKKVLKGYNDLQTTWPNLASEWDFDKNDFSPGEITAGSGKKVWWKCLDCGYSWSVSPSMRIRNGKVSKCPACSHNAINKGFNDFETLYPVAAQLWNYERNGSLLPSMVAPFSEKKVWWKCEKGHEFERAVKYSSRGHGCPICRGNKNKK